MKILQVIPYFCFGGAETMCENLTYALRELGHEVCVVSLYPEHTPISQRMEKAGVRIEYLDKKLGLDLSMIPKLCRIMKAEKPDVVHTHLDVIKYAVAAAKLAGIKKCVHTLHTLAHKEAEGRIQKIVNGFYFRRGWSVPVALSPLVYQTIVDFYGMDGDRVPVIFNGVDLTRCPVRKAYTDGDLTIVHVGRMNPEKNHDGLLRAFLMVLEAYPNCRLQLVGDGELREEIENQVQELGMKNQVSFLGYQSDVYPYLDEADIFVLPSSYEGMPMTIIEAMGSGLPVVASAVGGIPDMICDGESGLLISPEPESIRDALLTLIRDRSLREKLGRNAVVDSKRFSSLNMALEYCRVYRS